MLLQLRIAVLALVCSLLTACGGGGSGGEPASGTGTGTGTGAQPGTLTPDSIVPAPTTPAVAGSASAGFYRGTTSNGRSVYGALLGNGSYWVLYSLAGNPNVIAGVINGTGVESGTTYRSSDALDLNIESGSVTRGSVDATFASKSSLAGTVSSAGGNVTFTAAYDSGSGNSADLAAAAGVYTGDVIVPGGNDRVTFSVMADGSVTGSGTSGCRFNGRATPRSDINAFDVSVTLLGAPCVAGNQTVTGIAVFEANSRRLYSAALNSARTTGFLFLGTKS